MKKITVVIALLLVVALATPAIGSSFPDVPSNHWAYEAVNELVAAGIIEGYPDGTYKGQQSLTRYEIAMMVSRALDNIAAEREAMMDRIVALEEEEPEVVVEEKAPAGLTSEQAQDVAAIVKALIQKNMPEVPEVPEELTEKQINQVVGLIEALTFEFKAELKILGSDVEQLEMDLEEVEARVAALEDAEPIVSFSGMYSVDFTGIFTKGDAITPADEADAEAVFDYTANSYFFEDPYSTGSGFYVEQVDSDTDNETDSTPDFRMTDEEDYYVEGIDFENSLDLNVSVKKGPLQADLDLVASTNVFGGTDSGSFDLDSLSGTITTPDFVATIADEQSVTFKDYLFDAATVDGVVAQTDNHTFFVSRTVEEEDLVYTDVVYGAEDTYTATDKTYLRAGAKMGFDFFLPMNAYMGYEYNETDDEHLAVVGLDTMLELAGMDVTADLASTVVDGTSDMNYLLKLGASGEIEMFDLAFNYVKNEGYTAIVGTSPASGYDVKVGATIAMVEGSVYYEDYGTAETTLRAEVPAGELSFAGVNVDGSYRYTTLEDDGLKEERAINASTTMAGIDLSYAYDYDADNEIFDPELDRVDDGQPSALTEEDDDVNTHTFAADYAVNDMISLGMSAEFDKAIANDATDIIWASEFVNTNTFTADYANGPITAGLEYVMDGAATITARYTHDMFEAGMEKVLDGDLVIDGTVWSPTYNVMGFDVSAEACMKRNIDTEAQNLGVMVDLARDFNERLAMTAGMEYANKEIDVDYAGVKIAGHAGFEYSVTEDVTANANYEYLNWAGETNGDYTAQKATMGVDVAF